MSFAMRGLTHCIDCGTSLSMYEHYRCSSCEEEYQKEIEKNKLNEIVNLKFQMSKLLISKEKCGIEDWIKNEKDQIKILNDTLFSIKKKN